MSLSLTAAPDDSGRRLDRILRKALRELPLSAIHRLLRKGAVLVDGKSAPADYRIRTGQSIIIESENVVLSGTAEVNAGKSTGTCKLDILFEGAGLLVLNKPAGIVVHGTGGRRNGSLEDQVRSYLRPKISPSLSFRPGPLHRLDKPSSGIIAFSTSLEGASLFSALMRERKIKKFYLALVEGSIKSDETWQDELVRDRNRRKTVTEPGADKAKSALTRVAPLAENSFCTLILAEIKTGRTHQIRVQAASHGHPLLGDRKYGGHAFPSDFTAGGSAGQGFLLHAWRMEFPPDLSLPVLIEAPLPDYFQRKVTELFPGR